MHIKNKFKIKILIFIKSIKTNIQNKFYLCPINEMVSKSMHIFLSYKLVHKISEIRPRSQYYTLLSKLDNDTHSVITNL